MNELLNVHNKLTEQASNLNDLNINSYTINENKNKIVVFTDFNEEVNKEGLAKYIDIQYISFEKANYIPLSFDLLLGEHLNGLTNNQDCSSGFYAKNSSNKDVLVTAGHCNKIGTARDWHKGHRSNGDKIGSFDEKVAMPFQDTDASTILLNNDVNITPKIGLFNLSSVKSTSETSGQTIYYKGYASGADFGTYAGGICLPIPTHMDPDMGHLCDLALIDGVSPIAGDSGGVVFTVPGAARLYGIIAGGLDTNNDGISDMAVYSKIDNIIDELNLGDIYLQ